MSTVETQTALVKALYSAPSGVSESTLPSAESTSREVLMAAMWKRLREYLGQTWVRERGEVGGDTFKAWSYALQNFSKEYITRGVKACQDWKHDFPPTLGQFKELCATPGTKNFTDERMALETQHGKPIESINQLIQQGSKDTPIVRRAKAEMAALHAGKTHFEFDGRSYPLQTREQAMHALGLNARYSNSAPRSYAEVRG